MYTPSSSRVIRWAFIALGSMLVAVGVVGLFLPLLPSTVFFLMALGCYGKSSPGAYRWMTTNGLFGRHLREYKEEKGATIAAKVTSIVSLWLGIGMSAFLIGNVWVTASLLVVAVAVSAHLFRLKTIQR